MSRRLIVVLACIIWAAVPARGWAADPSSQVELGPLLTSPRRIPGLSLEASHVPGNVTVLTAEDVRRVGAATVPQLLSRVDGIILSDQQGFGLGADSTVNLRGHVNSSRTNALVLVDGVRQNRLTGDEVHWQAIPVDHIERIEILRGGGGLIYGEGALAGVINILTKQAGERLLETEETTEFGSYGWQRHAVSARGRARGLTYGVNYTRRLLEGYRESSASRNTTVTTHVGFDGLPDVRTALHVLHSEDTTGFPGGLTQVQTQTRRRQTNPFHGFNENETDQVSLDLIGGPWAGMTGNLNFFWRRWAQSSEDATAFNGFTVTPSRGMSARTNYEMAADAVRNLLVSGFELTDDKATTGVGRNPSFGSADSESNRAGYGMYVEDTFTLWDRLSLVAGLRYDRSRYQESLTFPTFEGTLRFHGFSPKIGVTYAVVPNALDLFVSYARPFKAPNVDDLAARVPSFPGNVHLTPQQANTYEVGTRWTRGPVEAKLTGFRTTVDDEILLDGLTSQNQNFDTRRQGLELSAGLELPERGLRSHVAYTLVDAQFRQGLFGGYTIPGTPVHTLHADLAVSPLASCWVTFDWEVVNNFYRINDMTNALGKADNYGVLNLLVQYDVPARFTRHGPAASVFLKVENLTNEEYVTFQSSNGRNLGGAGEYPMPPTSFTGGVTMTF